MKTVDSVLDIIGNTPMAKLNRLAEQGSADVFVKCDYLNPSGSIKDRVALEMIRDAEEQGRLKPGYTIIEASTGNTGTSLSFVGTLLGYKVVIYMPEGMTPERIHLMESFGAEVHELKQESSGSGGVAGAEVEINTRQTCFEIESSQPKTWWARQFSNPANTKAHLKTGREILEQLGDELDAFVCSIGTGGTLYGVAKVLKDELPDVKVIGAEPAGGRFPISKGHWRVPGLSDEVTGGIIEEMMESGLVDEVVPVSNSDAVAMHEKLIKEEGIFCGVSSGANVHLSLQAARELGEGKRVATILHDSGDRYFTVKKYTT